MCDPAINNKIKIRYSGYFLDIFLFDRRAIITLVLRGALPVKYKKIKRK
jgi:hypothetical protein